MKTYKEEIADLCAPHTGLPPQEIHDTLTRPQHEGQGDFSFPCFALAKKLRKAPAVIAQEMASLIKPVGPFYKIEALSGYLNFFITPSDFANRTLGAISQLGNRYGASNRGKGKTIVSQPQGGACCQRRESGPQREAR